MTDLTAGLLGAGVGLLVALFGNVVLLPYVLKHQDRKVAPNYRVSLLGWDKARISWWTKMMYRFQMPLLFALVGAIFSVQMFGGSE